MKAAILAVVLICGLGLPQAGFAQTQTAPVPTPAPPVQPAAPTTSTSGTPSSAPSGTQPSAPAPSTRQTTVSTLTGKTLIGQNGAELGSIKRVVENNADKKQYLVVSRGGFLGFFAKEYLVPLDKVSAQGERLAAKDLTDTQLSSSPQFNSNDTAYRALDGSQNVSVAETK